MNAPARFAPRDRSAYAPAVDAFMPGCSDDERDLRASLMLMRDNATAALKWSAPDACDVLEAVQRQCTVYCLAHMPLDHLRDLRANMLKLLTIASALHTWNMPEGPDGNG